MTTTTISSFQRCIVSVLIIVLFDYLAGCAPGTVEPSSPTPIPTAAPTEKPVATLTEFPTQMPFVPKANISIVVHVPLSGPQSADGVDIQRAADMAVQQLAGPLNALGYQVELVAYDDKMEIKTAVANAKEIVADPQVMCGVGHYASSIMIQASEMYHAAGLAFVSPSNTSTTVTDRGYLEVNRVIGRNDAQGMAAAQFAKAQGLDRVYVIHSSWDPGAKNADYFKREADRIGLKVVGILTTDVSDNFEAIVARIMNVNPDLVYFASMAGQAGPFFRQSRAAGYMGTFLTIDDTPALVDLAGPLLIEGGGAYYTGTAAPAGNYPGAINFARDFENRYGAAPHMYAAQAYDAAGICMKAIEAASIAKAGGLPTREEVAKAIRALVDYQGITGTYNFDKKGDPILVPYFVYKVISADPSNWPENPVFATFEIAPPN